MIFLSYSSQNSALAGEIKAALEQADYSCFLAHDDIDGGEDWYEEIWASLRTCSAFVGLVTEEFNNSAFCQQEVGAAFALDKPRLLVKLGGHTPPGFAGRFQAVKRPHLCATLDTKPSFRAVRVETWIAAVGDASSFAAANGLHKRFSGEWSTMSDDEKLRWLLKAVRNNQVYEDGWHAGPFFKRVRRELEPLLTNRWLWDHDKEGLLHSREDNPLRKKATKKKGQARGRAKGA